VWQVARCAALGGRSWILRGVAFPLRSAEGRQFGCLVAGLLSVLHVVLLMEVELMYEAKMRCVL
jgi:hypothetical protein